MPFFRRLPLLFILFLILITTWLRLWRLPELPPGLWRDEAYNAMDALWMLEEKTFTVFFVGNTGREPMIHYLEALSLAMLGATPYTVRLPSALASILALPLMYRWLVTFFERDPDRRWLALIAASSLAFSFWYLVMSRTAYRASLVPLFVILTLYLFWLGWQRRSLFYFAATGVALGLSQYTYLSTRVLPLIFILFVPLSWIFCRKQTGVEASASEGQTGVEASAGEGQTGVEASAGEGQKQRSIGEKLEDSKNSAPSSTLYPLSSSAPPLPPCFLTSLAGLLLMAVVSFLVFLPLGLFFWRHPTAFLSRAADISIANRAAQAEISVTTVTVAQLWDALQVFIDGGQDPNWRHTLVGVPGFDWLARLGFWLGLIISLSRLRQPPYLLLLISLLVLWLPALLSLVGALRLSGFLVPYYTLMAIGLLIPTRWAAERWLKRPASLWPGLSLFSLVLIFSGGLTGYNYFVRWANQAEVYRQFRGPLVDLTHYLIDQSATHDILIPFPMYVHPTVRFLLQPHFQESNTPPAFSTGRPALLVDIPHMVDLPLTMTYYASYVWLARDLSGQGLVYVLRPHQLADLASLSPTGVAVPFQTSRSGGVFATLKPIKNVEPVLALAQPRFEQVVDYHWNHEVRLVGFEFKPTLVGPGQSPALNLYWQSLTGQPFPYNIFIQLLNSRGEALGQWTDTYLSDQHRWRAGFLTPTQQILWLDPQARPGPYLVRLGLFEAATGRRVPVYAADGRLLGDQVLLGLFYMMAQESDPRQPQTPLKAQLGQAGGDHIQLLGYTLPAATAGAPSLKTRLYWQSQGPIKENYTIFFQLLDSQGQRVTGWDSQPLAGQYPTSFWQPGAVVVDEFDLPLPERLPPGVYRLVTGMYDYGSGRRLPAADAEGKPLTDDMIVLVETRLQ